MAKKLQVMGSFGTGGGNNNVDLDESTALEDLAQSGTIEPTADENNAIFVDENDIIFIL